jgi:hypothetical protein
LVAVAARRSAIEARIRQLESHIVHLLDQRGP